MLEHEDEIVDSKLCERSLRCMVYEIVEVYVYEGERQVRVLSDRH
jgi:hypothetical protein